MGLMMMFKRISEASKVIAFVVMNEDIMVYTIFGQNAVGLEFFRVMRIKESDT